MGGSTTVLRAVAWGGGGSGAGGWREPQAASSVVSATHAIALDMVCVWIIGSPRC